MCQCKSDNLIGRQVRTEAWGVTKFLIDDTGHRSTGRGVSSCAQLTGLIIHNMQLCEDRCNCYCGLAGLTRYHVVVLSLSAEDSTVQCTAVCLLHYIAWHNTLHKLHLDKTTSDHTDLRRCWYTYSVHSINSCEFIPGTAHYHIIITSKCCNFLLIIFTYFRILIV